MSRSEPVNEAVFVKPADGLKVNNVVNDGDVDGKQDDTQVVKVVGVADEQNSDELNMVEEARFEDQWSSSFSKKSSNNSGLEKQKLDNVTFYDATSEPVDEAVFVKVNDETKGFSLAESIEENNQAIDVESTSNNDAQDQASELEKMVLLDGKQDDMKVLKVIGVADEQNSDEPYVLEGQGGFQGVRNDTPMDMHMDFMMETSTSTALVSCDGLGGYDWSDQAEDGPNYALMAFSSSSSNSDGIQ
ncbi:hypothetical protein Tco_0040427 [Tanacetum coccineum]